MGLCCVALGVLGTVMIVKPSRTPPAEEARMPEPIRDLGSSATPDSLGNVPALTFSDSAERARGELTSEFAWTSFSMPMKSEPWVVFVESGLPNENGILKTYKEALDNLYSVFRATFGKKFPSVMRALPVVVLRDRMSFEDCYWRTQHERADGGLVGFYEQDKRRTITYYDPKMILSVLLHEGVHQLIGYYMLARSDTKNTEWFHEGLACAFETYDSVRIKDDYYAYSNIGKFNEARHADVRLLRNKSELKSWLSLRSLTGMTRKEFFDWYSQNKVGSKILRDEITQGYYAMAWALTYYLLHHTKSEYREAYVAYMSKELGCQGGREAFEEALSKAGVTLDELDAELEKFVNTLP